MSNEPGWLEWGASWFPGQLPVIAGKQADAVIAGATRGAKETIAADTANPAYTAYKLMTGGELPSAALENNPPKPPPENTVPTAVKVGVGASALALVGFAAFTVKRKLKL